MVVSRYFCTTRRSPRLSSAHLTTLWWAPKPCQTRWVGRCMVCRCFVHCALSLSLSLLTRALPACSPPQFPGCLSCGLNGKILQVPVNFTFATVLVAGHGINSTMYNWGGALLQRHGKGRTSLGADRAVKQLGYWTGESKQGSLALVWCYVCMTHLNVKPWHILLRGCVELRQWGVLLLPCKPATKRVGSAGWPLTGALACALHVNRPSPTRTTSRQ